MPRLSERRAVSSKMICLANSSVPPETCGWGDATASSVDDREDVLLTDDEQLIAFDLEFGAGVLRVEDLVADLDVHRLALAVLEDLAGAGGDDLAFLRLLLGGVRQDDAALGHLFAGAGLDDDAVTERAKLLRSGFRRSGCGQRAYLLFRPGPAAGVGLVGHRRPAWPVGATSRGTSVVASRRPSPDPPAWCQATSDVAASGCFGTLPSRVQRDYRTRVAPVKATG